ncbi:MAG: glycosyltransferase family 39 protein [Acidobacteria bacterium]|nr:glycosyltransferase family 39 protein [Acidobacteriota bacterium]
MIRPPAPTSRLEWIALAAIALVAAGLRSRSLDFGLPAVYNPDEIAILSRSLAFATGDLNPRNFLYPTFFFYALFGWIGLSFVWRWLTGSVASTSAFQTEFFTDPSAIYLAGRTLGVVCGVAGVVAVWALGRRLLGPRGGLVAALFLAVMPVAVIDAHYIKHDVPVTLAVVVAHLAMTRLFTAPAPGPRLTASGSTAAPGRGALLAAGAACGVAFSTHYYTIFLALPLGLAAWWSAQGRPRADLVRAFIGAGVSAAVVFFALSPFLLVEPATAWRDIVANRQIVVDRSGAGSGRLFASAGEYAVMLWRDGARPPIVALAVVGWLAWRRRQPGIALWTLIFPVAFLLFITNTVAAARYLNPVLPFVALWAAAGVLALAERLRTREALATALVALLASASAARASWHVGTFFGQDDTRTLAQRFIEAHVPDGASVLVQPYSVQLAQSRASLEEALRSTIGDPSRASTKFALRLALDPWPSPAYRTIYLGDGGLDVDKIYVSYEAFSEGTLDALRRLDIDYVVLKRYDDPLTRRVADALEREADRFAIFSPFKDDAARGHLRTIEPYLHNTHTPIHPALERPGPMMEIWKVRPPQGEEAGAPAPSSGG